MNIEDDVTSSRLRWVVATVPINEVTASIESIVDQHFSRAEAAELSSRHPRTTAGALAAKEALCELYGALSPSQRFNSRDFILQHDERGAQVLFEGPPLVGRGGLRHKPWISVSHTRDHAYGLAMVDEAIGG